MVTFEDVLKFNPYHDQLGRFTSGESAVSFTYSPGKSTAHDKAIQRARENHEADDEAPSGKGFKGTLYHGSPETNIDEFDINRAGENTSSGEKLIFFTDSKQVADDFSYERLEGSTAFTQQRGKKGRVYEVDVEMKNPLDFRNLSDLDIENILQLDADGLLTPDLVKQLSGNHQLLKASLKLDAKSLKNLGYDGLIANMGKDGRNALEYAVVDSGQTRIVKTALPAGAMTFDEILKFNPYHDARGRFASANSATSFTIRTKDPSKQGMADKAKEKAGAGSKASTESDDSPRMQSVHQVEDRIRDQFYESAAVIDKDGNVLFRKDGAMGEVGFTKEEQKMLKGNTVTHNHPDDTMLSTEDAFAFVRDGMYEMRATSKDGTTYSIKQGEGYTYEGGQKFFFDFEGGMKAAKLVAEKETLKYRGDVMDGTMSKEQFSYEFGKVVTSEMINYCNSHAKNYNVDFSVEKRKVENRSSFQVYTGKSDSGSEILKFNPYHDSKGRFASANTAASFTIRTKDPGKQHLADAAAERERARERDAKAKEPKEESPRMQAIHGIEDKIRHQNYESAAIVDNDGNVLLNKDGGQRQVGFTPLECAMMKDNTLTHNHPSSSMFSGEDISCFVGNNMQEIRATNREGITYSIKRGNGYSKENGAEFLVDYEKRARSARALAQLELDAKGYAEKIWRGEITQAQANKEFGKVVTKELTKFCENKASDYNLEFNAENRSVGKSAGTDDYILLDHVYTSKSDEFILDKETEDLNDAAFNEWLDRNNLPKEEPTEKSFTIIKTDDKRLVFGWASVSITVEGEQLEDRQKDMIDPEDLEEAAYEYVLKFRDTGEEHISTMRKKGKLVESCVFTAEKQKAMGIPEGILPIGWWIGFKIEDDAAWEKVKNGTYKMFSIEGKAKRVPVEKAAPTTKTFDEILTEGE